MWSFVILNKQFVHPIASFQEPTTKIGQYAGIQDRGRLKGLGPIEETKAYENLVFRRLPCQLAHQPVDANLVGHIAELILNGPSGVVGIRIVQGVDQ